MDKAVDEVRKALANLRVTAHALKTPLDVTPLERAVQALIDEALRLQQLHRHVERTPHAVERKDEKAKVEKGDEKKA